MRKVEFTQEFYKAVYNELVAFGNDCDFEDDFEREPTISVVFGGVEYELDIEATFGQEWHDESFDHEFGTWHDDNACWVFNGDIKAIGEVKVYDMSDGGNGEEVAGFDEAAFWQQFDRDWSYSGIKVGDKVVYREKEYEFVSYNTMLDSYKLKDVDGKLIHTNSCYKVKKVA